MLKSKKHRLEPEFYKSQITSFTLCLITNEMTVDQTIFEKLNETLIKTLIDNDCLLHIWLLMPDHCHMIIQSNNETNNILKIMDKFKQHSGYWFYKDKLNLKWQTSYYDHILRNEKDLENQIYYILNNPVRKGIVENWKDYPYKSSMIYDLDEL
jgi:putative transposase